MRPLRIGRIAFTNVLPIYHYFEPDGLPVELVPMVPSQLNRLMAAGEIDMGPISSFAYADQYPNYVLLPDLSVSARGRVGSIFLFTRDAALSDLRSARIALTNTSASSVALLKVLLNGYERGNPEYLTMPPSLGDMMEQADAALLIGDDAIRAQRENPGYRVLDLGWEWYQRTGLYRSSARRSVNWVVMRRSGGSILTDCVMICASLNWRAWKHIIAEPPRLGCYPRMCGLRCWICLRAQVQASQGECHETPGYL
jgi:chorismate dehydratase